MKALKWTILPALALALMAWSYSSEKKVEDSGWLTFEEALELHKEKPKKWFVDVYTDWCGWCKRMDATTFKNEEILKVLDEHYYKVKFDAERKEPITIGGKEYKFVPNGRRGYHELASELLQGRLSYPTVVFLDENVNMIQPLAGYKQAKEIHPILQFIGADHYKTTTWEEFHKTYKSPFEE